jgi:endoglucanase
MSKIFSRMRSARMTIATVLTIASLSVLSCTGPVAPQPVVTIPSTVTPTPDRTAPAIHPPKTGLRVVHNQFINGSGQLLRLVGFNVSGTEYACIEGWGIFDNPTGTAMDPSVVSAMATWVGANAVRVPLNEQCWLGLGVSAKYGGVAYQRAIRDYVKLLNSHGFVAVLDLHRSAPGSARSLEQEQMPDRDHSVEFWRQVAATFKSDSSVIFDLFNEPAPFGEADTQRAWQCWRDGGCTLVSANGGGQYVAAGMNELIRAIRAVGAKNIVLAGGIFWAEMLTRWLDYQPDDPLQNLAASFHDYSFNTKCASPDCYNTTLAQVAAQVPIYAGEVGPDLTIDSDQAGVRCPPTAVVRTGFAGSIFDWLDSHGASYAAWSWNNWPSCWSLIVDWSGRPTGIWGKFVKERLAASHAGSP